MKLNDDGVRRHFNYSNVMSTLSVFLVIAGGTAIAASVDKNSVKSKSVKDNSLRGKDVKDNSLTGSDVEETSLEIPEQSLPPSLPPSGPAGGALSGSYPNPALADGSVNSANVADQALTDADIGPNAIQSSEIQDGSLDPADIGDVVLINHALSVGTVVANDCNNYAVIDPALGDTSNAHVIVTPDFSSTSTNTNHTGEAATTANRIWVKVCNPTGVTVDAGTDNVQILVIK